MCLFKSWFVHGLFGLLVLLFYDIKKFSKIFLRSFWIKIVRYHCIESIPWYLNLETCFYEIFIDPLLYGKSLFS